MGSRAELLETLRKAASSLREVEERKMFGCEALFTRGSIFALVWKTGRIGVKLPDEGRFGELARQKGAEPWRAGPMVMAHWLLVPPALEDAKKLAPWVKVAHEMAAAGLGKLKVPKKIRRASGVKRGDEGGGKRETKMAAKKKGNEDAIASAGESLANTPQAARTVAEEVVRAVTKVAKAAAGAAKAVVSKGKKKAGAAKKKAGAAKKKAGKAVKKVASKAKKTASKAKKTAKKK